MVWLIILSELLAGAVQAGLYRGDGDGKGIGDLGMAATLLDQGEEGAILGPKLGEGMAEGIELLGVDRARRFGDIFVLRGKGHEDAPQLLPPEVVDAGVARQPEEPRLELGRGLEAVEGANHLDKYLLRNIFHRIAPVGDGIDKACNAVLIIDDKLALCRFVAFLGSADKFDQVGRGR
jgi:hypothetical protein